MITTAYETCTRLLPTFAAKVIAVVVALLVSSTAYAEHWTLPDVLRSVTRTHPRLHTFAAGRDVSRAGIRTAGAYPNPYLITDNGTAEFTYRILGIEQTIELGPKRRRRMALASAYVDVHQIELEILTARLRNEARKTYIQAYYAQEREHVIHQLIDSIDELIREADLQPGELPRADVLEARLDRLQAFEALQTAALEHIRNDTRLNSLLSRPPNNLLELAAPDQPSAPSWLAHGGEDWRAAFRNAYPALISRAIKQRPELRKVWREYEVADAEAALARTNRSPNLRVTVGPDLTTNGTMKWGVFAMAGLEMPMFNRQRGPLEAALAKRRQLQQENDAVVHDISWEVADAVAVACFEQFQFRRYERELMPTAEALYRDALEAFRAGKVPFLVPVRAQKTRIAVLLEYLLSRAEYHLALAVVDQALGWTGIDVVGP